MKMILLDSGNPFLLNLASAGRNDRNPLTVFLAHLLFT
jgi:hypothetical protein